MASPFTAFRARKPRPERSSRTISASGTVSYRPGLWNCGIGTGHRPFETDRFQSLRSEPRRRRRPRCLMQARQPLRRHPPRLRFSRPSCSRPGRRPLPGRRPSSELSLSIPPSADAGDPVSAPMRECASDTKSGQAKAGPPDLSRCRRRQHETSRQCSRATRTLRHDKRFSLCRESAMRDWAAGSGRGKRTGAIQG